MALTVGIPKEIKAFENRVGLVPGSIREVIRAGGKVVVEARAGEGIGINDDAFRDAGAEVLATAEEVFERADLIVKVKEPQLVECRRLREGQTIFTYLHLAADPQQTRLLLESKVSAIAYETVTASDGGLPLLTPMSQVAGRMSIQAGARYLEATEGGRGILLGGVPGVAPGCVVILGAGVVGSNALRIALGMEADVIVLDKSLSRLQTLDLQFGSRFTTIYATEESVEQSVAMADLVIGAVLIPGASAPKLITRQMLHRMRPHSVLVDVAIDQGGCAETSRPTTHEEPTYMVDGITHYCVTNMPAAVARTSTFALNNATLPFVLSLVQKGVKPALLNDPHFLNGLNICRGKVTCAAVARSLGYEYIAPRDALLD